MQDGIKGTSQLTEAGDKEQIAAEKDLSDKPELLTEYRRTLSEHAMLSGRLGTYFVEIAEELINNNRINF